MPSSVDENQPLTVAECRQFCLERTQSDERQDLAAESNEVSNIVARLADDETLVNAASLNCLLREQLISVEEVARRFGPQLAEFCRQLATLERLAGSRDGLQRARTSTQQAESLRRLLLAVVNDVRLMLVRLAEVLYQLRQAKTADASDQHDIAETVRTLYAPLANRLGVWQLKWELEDLSFRYLQPDDYRALAKSLNARRADRENYLEAVKSTLAAELRSENVRAELTSRPKHIYSIWRKLQRKQTSVENLADLRAVRILVDDVTSCYSALGVVHRLWSYLPHEFDDYIANPKGNYYRSLHTAVVGPDGLVLEVQIRTHDMHAHAELGVAAHWRYKEGGNSEPVFEQKIRWLRELLEPREQSPSSDDFLADVRDEMDEDRVYAISPAGDIVDLPKGATPLDFAYQVHTQIGHRCRGAKINGRIVTLTTAINNGDQIEIITGKEPQPSRDWLIPRLGFLVANRSRAKVRSWFRQLDSDQNRKQGRELLERELSRLSARDTDIEKLALQLKTESVDRLYIALGAGDLTVAGIATALQHLSDPSSAFQPKTRRRRGHADAARTEQKVIGVGDLMSQFAQCCRPIPPDPIGGYITQGRGISIHRKSCGNFRRLRADQPARVLGVHWSDTDDSYYATSIRISALDQPGILRDLGGILADDAISVTGSETRTNPKTGEATINMQLEVSDLPTLGRALGKIDALPYVLGVARTH